MSYFDGGVACILYLLYSPDLCHCIKAFSERDHHTAVTLLPQLQRHNNILCRHPQYPYPTTYLVHHAIYNGWKDITELLITTYNCDSTQKDSEGWTALHHAAYGGHTDIVRCLVENCNCDVNVNVKDNTGYTPLHHAAHEGHMDIVRCLVENCNCDVNVVNVRENTGYTPLLHYAAREGHTDIVKCLVENSNCDVNVKDSTGYTPLHHAACEGHMDIVRCLVENCNCDVNDVNIRGYTPLLHYAAREGHTDIVRRLVENSNCDVNVKDRKECTPLHHAAREGHTDIVKCLVENSNCDVNVKDSTGYTSLHYAAREGHTDIVRSLLVENSNCDVNVNNSTGYTPLHHAARGGHTDIVRCLVENRNCDVNVTEKYGCTPLHYAVLEGHTDIVKCLVENSNCDVNVKDSIGYTPLHHAAYSGHINIVMCLVEHTATIVMAKDHYGATPFHLACQYNSYNRNIPVIKYFLSIPVVFESFANKTSDYRSPLSVAEGNAATIFHQFERVYISHPVGSFINIFLLGHTGAGKTSLCHVLKERSSFFKIGKFVKGVKTLTAGIVPNKLRDHKSLGNVIVHDFAGQPEYYSSHAAILESLLQNCGAVFVVVINLTRDLSQQVRFWSGIVRNECQKAVSSECHLIVIASHADRVEFKQIELKAELTEAGYSDVPIFGLDCRLRSSDNLHSFVKDLSHLCTSIRNKQSPSISLYCNFLYSILEGLEDNVCTLEKLMSLCEESQQKGVPLPDDIVPSLKTLHSSGLIVYLENKEDYIKSWVVVRKEILLSEVDGILFAPSYFKEHRTIASNTGIITSRALKVVFENHDTNMLIAFLQSMKLCEELDKDLLKVTNLALRQEESLNDSDQLLFFPALISEERPQDTCTHIEVCFKIGWCLKVTSKYSFSVRFLHILLLHLAYQYSDAPSENRPLVGSLQRSCLFWKNGIHWYDDDGIETMVEQRESNQCVTMLMSCQERAVERMIQLHFKLMKKITDLQKEYCPKSDCKDYLLAPGDLQYPVYMEKTIDRISQGCDTVRGIDNKPAKEITTLLPIEPERYKRLYLSTYKVS